MGLAQEETLKAIADAATTGAGLKVTGTVTATVDESTLAKDATLTELMGKLTRPAPSTALEASRALRATAGGLYDCTLYIDPTAPTATYYLLVLDAPTLQGDGAFAHAPLISVPIDHVNGVRDQVALKQIIGRGISLTYGATLVLSSTSATLTHVAAAYLWLLGAEVGP